MGLKRFTALGLLFTCIVHAQPVPAPADDLGWINWNRLNTGEVLLKSIKEDRGTVTIELAIAINADWQAIWSILTACEISPEYVPHVIACSRIDSVADGNSELFLQTVKPAFFLPRFDHVFRLDYLPPERIIVSHISGPIERMDGSWRLIERPDQQIALIYRLTLKPDFPVPRFFVRNSLERDLPEVLREIRRRAEARQTN
jgi:hypothetical protein